MIAFIQRDETIICKKCGKIIDDPQTAKLNERVYNPNIVGGASGIPLILMVFWERRKQKKYNEKYGTEDLVYGFGVCKDCLGKRNLIKKIIKACFDVVVR